MDDIYIVSEPLKTTNETSIITDNNYSEPEQTTNETSIIAVIPIKNVLFVNSDVLSLNAYTNLETYVIGYDDASSGSDLLDILRILVNNNNINRVGFAFHYSGDDDPILFLNQEPFFTDSDLGDSVNIYSRNVQFMNDLALLGITQIDFLACNTLQNEKWKKYYQLLQSKMGMLIGASDDNTGNIKYGGDWIMESTHEEVGHIYFNAAIENWVSLLLASSLRLNTYYHMFLTVNATDQNAGTVITRTIYDNAGVIQDTQDISFGGMNIIDALSIMDGGGGNPYTIGIVDSYQNNICMDIGYCDVYTKALNDTQKMKLMMYVNTTIIEPHTAAADSNKFVVTVTGAGTNFWLSGNNGATSALNTPRLLTYGNVYILNQNHSTNVGYPLTINTNNLNTNRYTTGVVTNGTPGSFNSYTLIDLSSSVAGAILYYGLNGLSGGKFYTSGAGGLVTTNVASVDLLGSFTAYYLSNVPDGTSVNYAITGCLSSDLSGAALNGTFLAPYFTYTYTVTDWAALQLYFTAGSSEVATISTPLPLPIIRYTFDISGIIITRTVSMSSNAILGTLVNSGSNGLDGSGGIYSFTTGVNSISYNSNNKASGTYSLYNSSTTNYIKPPTIQLPSGFTFCTWMYIDNTPAGHNIFFRFISGGAPYDLDIAFAGVAGVCCLTCKLENSTNGSYGETFMSGLCFLKRWVFIAIKYSYSKNVVQYLNGRNINSMTLTSTNPTNTSNFSFFAGSPSYGYTGLIGYIDDCRIYNRLLTDRMINQIYKDSSPYSSFSMPQSTYLKAHYNLNTTLAINEVSGETATFGAGVSLGTTPGVTGKCAVFSLSSSSYITLPSNVLNNTTTGTIMMWVMPTYATNENATFTPGLLFSKQGAYAMLTMGVIYAPTSLTESTSVVANNGTVGASAKLYFAVNSSQTMVASTGSLLIWQWHHVAVTFTASNVTFYINGVASGSRSTNSGGIPDLPSNSCTLGCNSSLGSGTRSLRARMNGFATWNIALTASDISGVYNNQIQ